MGSPFREAVLGMDIDALFDTFAEDIVFRSPVVFRPYQGKDSIRRLFEILFEIFEDFRYVDEIQDGDRSVYVFETRVGDRIVHGIDMLRFGGDGKVAEFTVMVRPLSAATRLAEIVGARLAAT